VRSKEDYEQVLNLRKLAYGGVGKIRNDSEVADIFDSRSRIIVGIYKGQVIASTRLIFNEIEDQTEHEQFVNFPATFPRKDEICEITRVCTHPDFRGSDILMGLFRFVAITVVQSGRKYILGCATKDILSLYLKLGFEDTGLTYNHTALNNMAHTVFIGDVAKGLSGQGISPFVWNIVWRDVIDYMMERQIVQLDPMANVRIGLYKSLGPLSRFLYRKAKKPRRASKDQAHQQQKVIQNG
jgi:predicted GNAT family N-acyltransferase